MLQYSQYGNGNKIVFGYDSLDRMVSKKNNTEERFRYKYDGNSNLAIKEDLINKKNYRYFYDLSDKLIKIEEVDILASKKIGESKYDYDLNNNLSSMKETIKDKEYVTSYTYDKDNKPLKVTTNNKGTLDYKYDALGRRTEQTITIDGKTYTTKYDFKPGMNQCTTEKIQTVTNGTTATNYTYDYNGNIETITANGKQIKYYYNELNELKREDNQVLNKTITYTYDIGGNILSKVEYPYTTANPITVAATSTINYGYTDGTWKEKLTSYNGKAITYDAIGNPLTYDGTTYTWEMGRQLKSINKGSLTVSYKYDDGGIRTEKTVNGVTTSYNLLGDKVTYEETGADKIYYTYDAAGNLISMTLNGVEYYYLRNGQNDIIGLVDKTVTQVVSYTYDSWGKLISIDGTQKATVGAKNPYRYRGYRYDTETGLYYLNSRYYNPELGRFINADGLVSTGQDIVGYNMFAYCLNNPVNMSDEYGCMPGSYMSDGGGKVNKPTPKPPTPNKSNGNSGFNPVVSGVKAAVGSAGDWLGETVSKVVIKGKLVWESFETMGIGTYVPKYTSGKAVAKKGIGLVGTVAFTAWDVGSDIKDEKYMGAAMNIGGAILGFGVGMGLSMVGAFALTLGAPALVVTGAVLALGIGSSMLIDFGIGKAKDWWYGRKDL